MRKLFSLFFALVATTSLWAHDFEVDGIYYNYLDGNNVEVTYRGNYFGSYVEHSGAVTIPETVTYNGTTFNVTSIGYNAFYRCTSLTSITIPNSVTSIGSSAFSDCTSLTSITIPNSVTSIGDNAFSYCSSSTSVTIPNSVTSIGDNAFFGCISLTSVILTANSVEEFCKGQVNSLLLDSEVECNRQIQIDGKDVIEITIPNTVTNIGFAAFYNCSSLTSVTIGESVISIGNSAFQGCSSLTSVTIGENVTSIGEYAFFGCPSLTSITCEAETPPTVSQYDFYDVSRSIPVYVPCGCVEAYKSANGWNVFNNIQVPLVEYSISLIINDSHMGTAKVDKNTACGNQISATAKYGYHFVRWSDGVTDNIRTLVLTQDTVLTAEFAPNKYTITTVSSDTQRGTTQGDTTVNYLEYITISATANYGYHFVQWNDGNSVNPRQVQVTKDMTYSAYFDKNTYAISLSCNEGGRVEGVTSAEYLDRVTISATANYGYHFAQWSDGNTDNPRTLTLTQDTVLTAEFAPNKYTITIVSSDTQRGTTQGDTTVNYLEYITISATASYGYHFVQWNDGNKVNPRQVQVTKDMTYTATFDKNIYNISLQSNNGTIESVTHAAYLDNVTMMANADYGYHFAQWSDGVTDNPRTFVITQDTTFTAEFAPNKYTITTVSSDTQRGTTSGDTTVAYLDSITISAAAYYGYHFSHWEKDSARYIKKNAASNTITIKAKVPSHWTDKITVWVWSDNNTGTEYIPAYENGWYVYTYTDSVCNIIFKNGYGWNGDYNQTVDILNITEDMCMKLHQQGSSKATYTIIHANATQQIQVTENAIYTAYFDKNTYYITKNYDSNQGNVNGSSSGEYLDTITLTAEPNCGYHFVRWSDGNIENPRYFILTQDTAFSAEFAQSFSGQCGDNLYWVYANDTLTITGTGAMYDERPWGLLVDKIQKIALPTGITHIGNDAFQDCMGLRDIDLPYTLETIGDYSFNGCRRLITINCYPLLPPIAESTSFSNYSANLYAPCDNLDEYKYDMVFGQFKYFECIGSESVSTNGTVVTPGSTDVTITWPTDENADTYTIVIMKGDVIFCKLLFNKEGQLLNIAFAPGRDGQNRAVYAAQTANGLRFTVTGLEEKTKYGYDVSSQDEEDNTISSYTGEFTTQSTTAVDNITTNNANIQKIMRDGQLIIIRNGVEYNAVGQEM